MVLCVEYRRGAGDTRSNGHRWYCAVPEDGELSAAVVGQGGGLRGPGETALAPGVSIGGAVVGG